MQRNIFSTFTLLLFSVELICPCSAVKHIRLASLRSHAAVSKANLKAHPSQFYIWTA